MFSVEDLLVSHEYKQSKSPTNSSEDPVTGNQNEDTGRMSGQAPQNGTPIHPGAIPKTNKARKYPNDNKNNLVFRGRQKNTHRTYFSGPGNMEGGLYDQSLSRSSPSKKEKDFTSGRRQCQDFGALDYPNRVESEIRMGAACALFEDDNKGQGENEEEIENMSSNKQETTKPPGDYRRQSLKKESWKQPTAFGQRKPDTDNKKMYIQDVYSGRQNIAASHVKNKPQTFPSFILLDNSNYAEIPAVASGKQHKVKPELESLKHSEPATRPKYGRPLKPPSYEFHQQSRGIVESNPPQDEQQKRKTTFYVSKVDESDQNSTLGPPLYIPPPSYRSDQQSKNQPVPNLYTDYDERFVKEMKLLEKSICIGSKPSVNQLQMKEEEPILHSETYVKCQEKHRSSVQYIPFDDPRIRHIKVIHPLDHEMKDQAEDVNNTSIFHKNTADQEFNNSGVAVPDSINTAVKCSQVTGRTKWFADCGYADQDNCTLYNRRGSYSTGNSLNGAYSKARPSAQSPGATALSSEILTKVKTFEPGTEVQGKNHLKKKTNETMFCLVSVPVQSELNSSDFANNNNNIIQFIANEKDDLKYQSFRSMSSTDLELQALTGNMINKNVLEKQDFQRPEFKQMNYASWSQPPKHKELEYSGSWPGNRYKDQETQTSFREEPKIQQPLHWSKLKKPNTVTNAHFLKYGSAITESAPSSLPILYRKDRPILPARKNRFNKPSKPECPKAIVNPKTGLNKSCTTSTGLSGWKNKPSFAHKEEKKSPCSSKEAFGQFLLKPVSRRPRDAISELESFNKKLQNQEERNEDNEQKQERGNAEEKAYREDEGSQDSGYSVEARKLKTVTSVPKKGTNKSKGESENASKISNTRVVLSDLKKVRSEAREIDKSVNDKKGNVGLNQNQDNVRKIIKPAISLHPMQSNVSGRSDSEKAKPFNSINSKGASVENHKNKDSDKLKRAAGRNTRASETAFVAPLFFKRRNQGRSEPNLTSVSLDVNEGTRIPDSSTKKISLNESLRTRASRILGIEVAVECLTANNKTLSDEDTASNKMAQRSELSNKKILRYKMKTDLPSSKGKPKSSWLKSTFNGENILGSVKDQCTGEEKLTRKQYFQQHPDLGKYQEDHAHTLQSSGLPLNIEKKTKSTSKVTVPKQGKVASAVNRAVMDRVARMKEVDSVSYMRRLIIKNVQSGEDSDEDKQLKEPEEKGDDSATGYTELPCKLSQGSCVSKRIISLNENERLGNRNTKKSGKDLPSSEVYDPSQVERV